VSKIKFGRGNYGGSELFISKKTQRAGKKKETRGEKVIEAE
jgi:hypothetical protein